MWTCPGSSSPTTRPSWSTPPPAPRCPWSRSACTRSGSTPTASPARCFGLEAGRLVEGGRADVTVIDPDRERTLEAARLKSKSRNSPFLGWQLKGAAVLTIAGGRVIHEEPQ